MKNSIILMFIGALSWFGCSEKEIITPVVEETESSHLKNLTSGEWIRVGFELNGKDVFTVYPPCGKDDVMGYSKDGLAYVDQGALKCDTTYPQRATWTWSFTDDETKILETLENGTEYIREIRVLTDTHFEYISYNLSDSIVAYYEKY